MVNVQIRQVKEMATKSSLPDADYVVNPYVGCPHKCVYCYADFMRRFTGHGDDEWGEFLDVKVPTSRMNTRRLAGKVVLISSVTDPYNPFEARYRSTRAALEALGESEARVEILTKSALVLRDLDLLKRMSRIRVGISLSTLDEGFRRLVEPRASPVGDRLDALEALHREGISTYLFVAPVFPGITDCAALVERVGEAADFFAFENLNLRGGHRAEVLRLVASFRPELAFLYGEVFGPAGRGYWDEISAEIEAICRARGKPCKIYFYHSEIKKR